MRSRSTSARALLARLSLSSDDAQRIIINMAKDNAGLTPMMKQFFAVKAEHPEALLLFRCGDFYETYGDDALTASKILGIVLTRRSNSSPDSVPMAGFPYHSIDSYLPRLVRAGYKVAVCDQLEDPKLTKNIVKRGITEVVTPGVAFNEQLLDQKENNFLAGLSFEKDKCGAAFIDVSTGTFQVAEGSLDYILNLISSFSPKELLVPRGYEKAIREKTGESIYTSSLDEWAFVYENSVEKLKKQLNVDSLKGFGVAQTRTSARTSPRISATCKYSIWRNNIEHQLLPVHSIP